MNATRNQFGRTDLPEEQRRALTSAVRWEIFTLCYTGITIFLVAIVVGNSQSMRTAWVEDMLSTLPQIVFLVALPLVRRRPTAQHPYGHHRAMSIGHLVAGVALLAVGGVLAVESALGLIRLEHPSIGTVNLFGHTIWLGWLMIAVMAIVVVGPFFYGPADWHTNAASIVGVLGVGLGFWWLDGVAAIFISVGIISDGFRNTRVALSDLMDQRALRYDSTGPHADIATILGALHALPWVADAGVRARDMGQVLHIEAFIVPAESGAGVERIAEASESIAETSWQVQDVVVTLCDAIPDEATERITRHS
jgi:divalent metal cation (Fe/Co/Zn/Cd) transporter